MNLEEIEDKETDLVNNGTMQEYTDFAMEVFPKLISRVKELDKKNHELAETIAWDLLTEKTELFKENAKLKAELADQKRYAAEEWQFLDKIRGKHEAALKIADEALGKIEADCGTRCKYQSDKAKEARQKIAETMGEK